MTAVRNNFPGFPIRKFYSASAFRHSRPVKAIFLEGYFKTDKKYLCKETNAFYLLKAHVFSGGACV